MKCPHCKKEVENKGLGRLFILNVFMPGMMLSMLLVALPLGVEDGNKYNWDMAILALSMLAVSIHMLLYSYGKVKGRFLLFTYWIEDKRGK